MPILLPPYSTTAGATLVETEGGISSGERLTAQKGSDINRERITAKMEMLNLIGVSTNQGDDTIINSDDPRMADKWMSDPEWLGFKEEVAPDVSFLMKRMTEGYSYLGRMVMSTINREAPREPPTITAAASGIAIRHELLKGHPLQHEYRKLLLKHGNRRIRAATELSMNMSLDDLLLRAYASRMTQGSHESLEQEVGLLAEQRYDPDVVRRLEALVERYEDRFQMQFGEYRKELDELSIAEATKHINSVSYIRR
jgi:hypothetical protein